MMKACASPRFSQLKRKLWVLAGPLLGAALLSPLWLPWIGEFLVVEDPLQKAEALAILGGNERERSAAGALLFRQGYAGWLIITDMRLKHPGSEGEYSAAIRRMVVAQGVPAERILLVPGPVATTYAEAERLKEFTLSHGFRSLIVVTSPSHTRRARWLLRAAFRGSPVTLTVRSAPGASYQASAWWRTPADRRITLLEYAKIAGHLLGCRQYGDCGPLPWAWLESWQKSHPEE